MAASDLPMLVGPGEVAEKGLKGGALGLLSSVVMAVASTAPAYSLAATLGFVVAIIGTKTPLVCILAFVPMLFVSIGYSELNKADPDCGTTFTWATRAFNPWVGWLGGWGIVAADLLVMASLAQIAGQYVFLFVGAKGIGAEATSAWVLLVGVLFIVLMTYICYRGIEISAALQRALLSVELIMLGILALVALIKVYAGTAPPGHVSPSISWFSPLHIASGSAFIQGLILFLFIYWGWDTAVSINEETEDSSVTPGKAAIISTVVLLVTYAIVTVAVMAYAGFGTSGIGLGNSANIGDVLSVLGNSVFGGGIGVIPARLLLLMVLTSASASTQTTILPTARTTLSMAVYKAIPKAFARIHPRFMTPTVSTVAMGGISIVLYVVMNYLSGGNVIADSVAALGLMVAFYYGLTGFTCIWFYRHQLTENARNLWMQGILPLLGGLILFFVLGYSLWYDWNPFNSYTSFTLPFPPHWHMGGIFLIGVGTFIVGIILMFIWAIMRPAFFRGQVLTKQTPTLVREGALPGVVVQEPDPGARDDG